MAANGGPSDSFKVVDSQTELAMLCNWSSGNFNLAAFASASTATPPLQLNFLGSQPVLERPWDVNSVARLAPNGQVPSKAGLSAMAALPWSQTVVASSCSLG